MIKGINSSSRYISVSGGIPNNTYISPGAVGCGMLRWNPNMSCLEVNDGNSWKTLEMSYATIELNHEAASLMEWARTERDKQWARESKMKNNPALKKAYEAMLRAEENYELLESIAGDYEIHSDGVTSSP